MRAGATLLHRVRGPDCGAGLQQLDFLFLFHLRKKKGKNPKENGKKKPYLM